MIERPIARRSVISLILLSAIAASGCASGPKAHWRAGILPLELDEETPARKKKPEDVQIFFKQSFGVFEERAAKRGFACDSTTLLRRSELIPGRTDAAPPARRRLRVAELTTEEFPRDDEKSRLGEASFTTILGLGGDEFAPDRFVVVPSALAVERGLARLRALAAEVGADAVEEAYMTGYAEHQMWEGMAVSLNPRSTFSPIFADVRLLDFKLRDVRFHGYAVIYAD